METCSSYLDRQSKEIKRNELATTESKEMGYHLCGAVESREMGSRNAGLPRDLRTHMATLFICGTHRTDATHSTTARAVGAAKSNPKAHYHYVHSKAVLRKAVGGTRNHQGVGSSGSQEKAERVRIFSANVRAGLRDAGINSEYLHFFVSG